MSRRGGPLAVPAGLWQTPGSGQSASAKPDGRALRYRVESVDDVFRRAQSARGAQKLPVGAHEAIVACCGKKSCKSRRRPKPTSLRT